MANLYKHGLITTTIALLPLDAHALLRLHGVGMIYIDIAKKTSFERILEKY